MADTAALVAALAARNAAGGAYGRLVTDYDAVVTRCLELEVRREGEEA